MPANTLGNDRTIAYVDGAEMVMERVFDAPRELLWKVFTEPERIGRWWAGDRLQMKTVEMDVRPGGKWRWVGVHDEDGVPVDVPFCGEYLEVVPPERIVRTEVYDVAPFNEGHAVETMTFHDLGDGRTRLLSRSTFPSAEVLQGALATGMIGGALEAYDRVGEEAERLVAEHARV
jgi:uncharacterized protein YndB with AHSA1/START domain